MITVDSIKSALAILTRGKLTKKSLFFSEQLTKQRGLRSKLIQFIRTAVFSRNGCPAVSVGEGRFNLIISEEYLETLNSFLKSSATAMSNGDSFRRRPGSDDARRANGLVESARQRMTDGAVSNDIRLNADGVDDARAL